jgi:hypothetical protein
MEPARYLLAAIGIGCTLPSVDHIHTHTHLNVRDRSAQRAAPVDEAVGAVPAGGQRVVAKRQKHTMSHAQHMKRKKKNREKNREKNLEKSGEKI